MDIDECQLNDPCENPDSDGETIPWNDCFNSQGSYTCFKSCNSGQRSILVVIMCTISIII